VSKGSICFHRLFAYGHPFWHTESTNYPDHLYRRGLPPPGAPISRLAHHKAPGPAEIIHPYHSLNWYQRFLKPPRRVSTAKTQNVQKYAYFGFLLTNVQYYAIMPFYGVRFCLFSQTMHPKLIGRWLARARPGSLSGIFRDIPAASVSACLCFPASAAALPRSLSSPVPRRRHSYRIQTNSNQFKVIQTNSNQKKVRCARRFGSHQAPLGRFDLLACYHAICAINIPPLTGSPGRFGSVHGT
jgi:hypothetical protein